MIHAKVQGHSLIGLVVHEIFTIYGHGSHYGHVIQLSKVNLSYPLPLMIHMQSGFNWFRVFGEDV